MVTGPVRHIGAASPALHGAAAPAVSGAVPPMPARAASVRLAAEGGTETPLPGAGAADPGGQTPQAALAGLAMVPPAEAGRPAAPALAAQIAGQIAQAAQTLPHPAAAAAAPGPAAEVTLAPAELGRVTIRLEPDPGQSVLHLTVERPETLELMRRHLDLLEAALREVGQQGCAIALGGRDAGGGRPPPPARGAPPPATAEVGPSGAAPRPVAQGRLDLRL